MLCKTYILIKMVVNSTAMSLKQVLCIFARVKLQKYTKCKDVIYTEKKRVLNLLTKLNRNDLHCHFNIHLKCPSYKGYYVVDLTQLNTIYENCEDQMEGYHLRTFFEHGDETSFRNPKNKVLLT